MTKVVAIIQARCGSTRFPDKVSAHLAEKPLIWHVVNRLKFAATINDILLATTTNVLDDKLCDWAVANNLNVFRGSENDVLNRYAEAAQFAEADVIVRITADDPFKEPLLIDKAVKKLLAEKLDFVCNNFPPTYPEGLDVEVFTQDTLLKAEANAQTDFEREHVTQYFYRNPAHFKIGYLRNNTDLSRLRWTIDTEKDFLMAQEVYSHLYKNENQIFHWNDILQLLEQKPEIAMINADVARSTMYKK